MTSPTETNNHWSAISETGSEIGMEVLVWAYRIGGRPLFQVLLFPVIVFYFILRSDSRLSSMQYLERAAAKGGKVNANLLSSFRHFWQFGLSLIDKFAAWMGKIPSDQIELHGSDLIDDLISAEKGGVFAISHLGNFEVISALSKKHKGVKLTVLHHTRHAEKFNRILTKYASNRDIELLQVTELDATIAAKLSERVSNGEFVAIACDRTPIDNRQASNKCLFLGDSASFPRGPYILAQVLEAPLVLVLCLRENKRHHVYFEQLHDGQKVSRKDRETYITNAMQKAVRLLEEYTLKQPYQWFNFYDFWRN